MLFRSFLATLLFRFTAILLALATSASALIAPMRPMMTRVTQLRSTKIVEELTEDNTLLRNEIVRKDAIIEGLLSTLSASAMSTSLTTAARTTPLTDLCQISKEACDAVTPMLLAFYEKIADQRHGGASKLKADATYFTIADGIVQHMMIEYLFAGGKFGQIVGEEDESVINIKIGRAHV